ncbi:MULTISPECIES: hypothetical protein [unclassified Streptomyces]|uniref:hypothetical protein n=1 Tax=unclassified Streptomyces TaxID=2593676 RepID=UPI0033B6571E
MPRPSRKNGIRNGTHAMSSATHSRSMSSPSRETRPYAFRTQTMPGPSPAGRGRRGHGGHDVDDVVELGVVRVEPTG